MEPIIESIPNFSEGRDAEFLEGARRLVGEVDGVVLLDSTADPDHNRSVFTLAGAAGAIAEAILALAGLAVERIDLRTQTGQHPRIGAMDVVPFVGIAGVRESELLALSDEFGQRLWAEHSIPSFFYGQAATCTERIQLQDVRRGGYEALVKNLDVPQFDVGTRLHPTAGATAIGVRKPLIAWNVDLATDEIGPAMRIARAIRESSGGLPSVKALGLSLPTRAVTQVSMNLVDYEVTPPQVVMDRICELAAEEGVKVIESELIGLIPKKALGRDGGEGLRIRGFNPSMILEHRIEQALACELP